MGAHDQSHSLYTRTHVFIAYLYTVNLSFLLRQCRAAALKGPMSCRTRDDFFVSFHPSSRPNEALSATLRKLSKDSQIVLRVFLPLEASIEAF